MDIRRLRHPELQVEQFTTTAGQSWCILGGNDSGIDRFLAILAGNRQDCSADHLLLPVSPEVLSFHGQQELYEEEMRNDDSDFLNKADPGTLVREFLAGGDDRLRLLKPLGLDQCLDLGYRQLSSGQCRKLLLLQKLTGKPQTLIIQNPYDGLDERSCHELNRALEQLGKQGIELILFINSESDIPLWCSHLALIESGRLALTGERDRIVALLGRRRQKTTLNNNHLGQLYLDRNVSAAPASRELVSLRNGYAAYGDKVLFQGLNLTILSGDHTLITGPNGCGKSTLLDIITGDNPKCYANDLRIFGRKRGSGESIWDIKKHMGIVSPSLHRNHRIPGTALHVVLSGLHDSIGLYARVHPPEIRTARKWLNWMSLSEKCDVPFKKLAFAEQRLVLIARALIKRPLLLILDEPTHGLDDFYRNTLLDFLEKIVEKKLATILFVSHRKDEQRTFFHQRLRLESYGAMEP